MPLPLVLDLLLVFLVLESSLVLLILEVEGSSPARSLLLLLEPKVQMVLSLILGVCLKTKPAGTKKQSGNAGRTSRTITEVQHLELNQFSVG